MNMLVSNMVFGLVLVLLSISVVKCLLILYLDRVVVSVKLLMRSMMIGVYIVVKMVVVVFLEVRCFLGLLGFFLWIMRRIIDRKGIRSDVMKRGIV